MDNRGSIPDFFSSPPRSDWLWDPLSLLSNATGVPFLGIKAAGLWSW